MADPEKNVAVGSDASIPLTKEYINKAFVYLAEVHDLHKRNIFFNDYMVPNVEWEITGRDHSLAGTRHSVADHTAASFARLREKIIDPIKFVIRTIILEAESRIACLELRGYATRLNGGPVLVILIYIGEPYDNDYIWLTKWNEAGKIYAVRSYHDTNLAEKVLNED